MPDAVPGTDHVDFMLQRLPAAVPAQALDGALVAIAARYGNQTGRIVRLELEYPVHVVQTTPVADSRATYGGTGHRMQ